jgi:hypothetical protein
LSEPDAQVSRTPIMTSDPAARQKTNLSKFDRWFQRLMMLLPVAFVTWFIVMICWPVEGQIPFDSKMWIQSSQDSSASIRTRMKDDLVSRLKTERWTAQRVKDELGPAIELENAARLNYELGRRRGMWPFPSTGFLTSFDTWRLMILLDESGIVKDAQAHPD